MSYLLIIALTYLVVLIPALAVLLGMCWSAKRGDEMLRHAERERVASLDEHRRRRAA